MHQGLFLSRFSQPQAVFLLLIWLRLFITAFLLTAYGFIEWLAEPSLKALFNWPLILAFSIANLGLGLFSGAVRDKQLSDKHIFVVLMMDISIWFGLMFASGGAVNPAISYLLVLLSVAALALRPLQAMGLALYMVALYAWLMQQQGHAHHMHMFEWHLWGMWILFLMNALIMLLVIGLLSRAVREKDRAIAQYREQTVRDEQLIALGTLAANVAHELGTPLSTIAMLTEDFSGDDAELIQQQLQRCKTALAQLKHVTGSQQLAELSSTAFFQRLEQELLLLKPDANILWQDEANTTLYITPLLEQALLALMNNAIEAADHQITISLSLDPDKAQLQWDISHDGEPVSEDLLKVLGRQVVESDKQGLGIGYYLANASIEQLGGSLQIKNLPQGGVQTRVCLPQQSQISTGADV